MPAGSWDHWLTVAETAAASELGREIPCDMLREELEGVKICVCLWVLEGRGREDAAACVGVGVSACMRVCVCVCVCVCGEDMTNSSIVEMMLGVVSSCKAIRVIREMVDGEKRRMTLSL